MADIGRRGVGTAIGFVLSFAKSEFVVSRLCNALLFAFCAWRHCVETIVMRRKLAPVSSNIGFVLEFAVGIRFPALTIVVA
jgi:hypothetical protein